MPGISRWTHLGTRDNLITGAGITLFSSASPLSGGIFLFLLIAFFASLDSFFYRRHAVALEKTMFSKQKKNRPGRIDSLWGRLEKSGISMLPVHVSSFGQF